MPAEELSLSNGIVRCGQVWNVNKSPHFNSDHLTGRRRELCPCNLTFLIFFRFVGHTHYVMHINYLMLHYVNGYIYFNQINAVETPLTQWRTPKQIELNFLLILLIKLLFKHRLPPLSSQPWRSQFFIHGNIIFFMFMHKSQNWPCQSKIITHAASDYCGG